MIPERLIFISQWVAKTILSNTQPNLIAIFVINPIRLREFFIPSKSEDPAEFILESAQTAPIPKAIVIVNFHKSEIYFFCISSQGYCTKMV